MLDKLKVILKSQQVCLFVVQRPFLELALQVDVDVLRGEVARLVVKKSYVRELGDERFVG